MPFITNSNDSEDVDLHYKDYGSGQPVILIHGWPMSHEAWEQQVWAVVEAGYRCIAYDRRGFGISSAPWNGFDYTTLASDLREIILQLDLTDCILVGFSMGGGEVVRYFTEYGDDRIAKAALISSIIPLVAQKEDNPHGIPAKYLNEVMDALEADRPGFLKQFLQNFYNAKENGLSEGKLDYDFTIAAFASPRATIQCAKAWTETDFRNEMKNVSVPTLIVHGDQDNSVPIKTSADQAAKGIPNSIYKVIKGGPHGLHITHKKEFNQILLNFIRS